MAEGWKKINTERPYSLVNIILNYQSYSVATAKKKITAQTEASRWLEK